jgi:hypothetical protein
MRRFVGNETHAQDIQKASCTVPLKRPATGLAGWRQRWASPEDGSIALDPLVYDPRQWQLMPGSPGHRAAPGGTDVGADVRRVARMPQADRP